MPSEQELACVYAALALQDDGVSITAEKILGMTNAAGIAVEPFWASLFAKALKDVDVKTLISNVGSGVGAAPAAAAPAAATGGAPAAAAPAKEEKKKEEKKEESEDEDMGFGLFD